MTHARFPRVPRTLAASAALPFVRGLAIAGLAAATAAVPAARASAPAETHALAISWEPAFCMTHASKPECASETSSRADAHQFSLHGLWPQNGSYCGVSATQKSEDQAGQWSELPAVTLQPDTESLLQVDEPGTMSYLDRHEWTEHGTCSGLSQQDFFAPTLAMLGSINASNLGATVAANVGGHVTLSQLRSAAALDFGTYAKSDIEYLCVSSGGRSWLEEVRFHLHLPTPLPSTVQASYLTLPKLPASSSQLCPSSASIYIRAAAN